MPAVWEVVGGTDKGGILVRQGHELNSAEQGRLSTGALIIEKEVHGERMRYSRMTGSGPESGWVSLKVKDKAMIMKREAKRKPRVLALHGAPSNSNIMKFQTAQLRKLTGEDFEWIFLDGPCAWKPLPGSELLHLAERTSMEKAIAKDKPFVQWYSHPEPSPEEAAAGKGRTMSFDDAKYENVEEGVKFLDKYLEANAPIDIVVGFSQSGTLLAIYMDTLRKANRSMPWLFTVLFCGAMIDDARYALDEPLALPALYVHGGDADPWGRHGERCLPKMYADLEMLEHTDGHGFPSSAPRASEIYQRVLQRMSMGPVLMLAYGAEKKKRRSESVAKSKGYKVVKLSGTEFRRRLRAGEEIPEWFAFKSVVDILRKAGDSAFCA
ncbi:unnamed protein product [Symbiodinium natans]|uniref:Serine hydrolase FSH domain-containing protein n=1 Tax=Symbiodinium natans TaxID=878477 RepID=A0A812T0M1_9DINO|nr:unnamed protein product [Symbiodinium natans]